VAVANAAVEEANFRTCLRQRFAICFAPLTNQGRGPGYFVAVGHSKFVSPPWFAARTHPGNVAAPAL